VLPRCNTGSGTRVVWASRDSLPVYAFLFIPIRLALAGETTGFLIGLPAFNGADGLRVLHQLRARTAYPEHSRLSRQNAKLLFSW